MKNHIKTILFYLLLVGVIIAVLATVFHSTKSEKLVLQDVVSFFKADRVTSFVIDKDYNLTMEVIKVDAEGNLVRDAEGKFVTGKARIRASHAPAFRGLLPSICGKQSESHHL